MYREQLRELLTGYGPLFEVWHDGANGGDGYYGGARETRSIDRRSYYEWPETWEMVRRLQPDAVVFSDVGPDIRWVGNESGYAAETSWATFDPTGEDGGEGAPGYSRYQEAPEGRRSGSRWLPAECDVSIRPGWFWHEHENDKVKSPRDLFDLYCRSVGHGGSLHLNVPPDRRGLLHENDVASLRGFEALVRGAFAINLATGASLAASNVRGSDPTYGPANLLSSDSPGFWATDDGLTTPELTIELNRETTFNLIRIREHIPLGQRIESFAFERWEDGSWIPFAEGTSVGACRIVRLAEPVTARAVRLRITQCPAAVALSEIGLFSAP